jgi:hypothetical protein
MNEKEQSHPADDHTDNAETGEGEAGLPDTTDDSGRPVENPSG